MLNLTVPTNVQINIENDFISITGPLGCKKKNQKILTYSLIKIQINYDY